MKEFSIPMALFDLLPVIFFMAGFLTIAADMRRKSSLPAGILFARKLYGLRGRIFQSPL